MSYLNFVPPAAATSTRQHADQTVEIGSTSDLTQRIEHACGDLDVVVARPERTLWCYLKPQPRQSLTEALLRDLHCLRGLISQAVEGCAPDAELPLRYVVLASRTPGVFNLGSDLALLDAKVRARDRGGLRRYAHSCVEVSHRNHVGYDRGLVTIGLAQGDALGGGWECLMSCDTIIAEQRARFALPEVLFNLFPGMGARTYLSRRIGVARAEEIIMSGRVHTAQEMHVLGLVDVLAEDGDGERAVRAWIERNDACHNAPSVTFKARRRTNPVTLQELRDVADIWVDAALRLTEQDLWRMAYLAAAQDRSRHRRSAAPATVAG